MLGLNFENFSLNLLLLYTFYNSWSVYFVNLNYSTSKFCSKQSKLISFFSKIQYKNIGQSFIYFFFIIVFFYIYFFFTFKGFQKIIFFNLVSLNNKSFYFSFFYTLFLFYFFVHRSTILKIFFFKNNFDFLISLIFLFLFSIFIFFSNTLFSFFFLLKF